MPSGFSCYNFYLFIFTIFYNLLKATFKKQYWLDFNDTKKY